jgi:enamine deaminase RidA (YjgF/YER057c/UK114 family)
MPPIPSAQYVAFVRSDNHLYISGQVSANDTESIKGIVGRDLTLDGGKAAARLSAINLIQQMHAALDGDLARLRQIVRLTGYIQAARDFDQISQVMNGCSDLMIEIFGDRGRHSRSTIGAYRLPRNCAVEVDAIVAVD